MIIKSYIMQHRFDFYCQLKFLIYLIKIQQMIQILIQQYMVFPNKQ